MAIEKLNMAARDAQAKVNSMEGVMRVRGF